MIPIEAAVEEPNSAAVAAAAAATTKGLRCRSNKWQAATASVAIVEIASGRCEIRFLYDLISRTSCGDDNCCAVCDSRHLVIAKTENPFAQ